MATLSPRQRFLIGVAGAIAPETIRWYNGVTGQGILPHIPVPMYVWFITSVGFLLVAGFFTSFWHENNKVKCFYLGVSFPTFVSAVLSKAPVLPK